VISQRYFCLEGRERLAQENLDIFAQKYVAASKHLDTLMPDCQIIFEQLLVNHMFYNEFPYIRNQGFKDAFLSLIVVYSFLRLNLLAYLSYENKPDKIIDFFAAMFRLIEHSDFENITVCLLKDTDYLQVESLPQLIFV
jgi:hypothetical protein